MGLRTGIAHMVRNVWWKMWCTVSTGVTVSASEERDHVQDAIGAGSEQGVGGAFIVVALDGCHDERVW